MESLEKDFLAGLLDIPDPPAVSPPSKASKKRVALADLDTNVVEDQSNQQLKKRKKKTDTNAVDSDKQQRKKNTSSKKALAEPTGLILDLAEFDMAAQKTTIMDEMCKDVKLLLQTVLKMSSTVESLKKDMGDLAQRQRRIEAEHGHQAVANDTSAEQPHVSEASVFLPPLLQDSCQPSQVPETPRNADSESAPNTATPLPIAIPPRTTSVDELPSSGINRAVLKSVPEVLQKYSSLRTECKSGVLTVKLAREAFFGDAVLKRCTPRGWKDSPALPQTELNQLKATLYGQFPRFWSCPEQFESVWAKAQEALAQACKHLRRS